MDPALEQLHVDRQQRVTDAPALRERVVETIAAVLLAVTCVLLWTVAGPSASPDFVLIAVLIVLYAGAWQVTFEVGAGSTMPQQLVFVPMWFVVPPAALPLVVAASQVLGNVISSAREREGHSWGRVLIGIPDAWYAVGPALVLVAFSVQSPSVDDWPILLCALGAQLVMDCNALIREWAATGVRPGLQWRVMAWIGMVDLALAPIGLLAAIVMVERPGAVLAVVPIVLLLRQFAKERDDRIAKALELSHAYRGTAQLMGDVLEADDAYTGGEHTQGVVELAMAVGASLRLSALEMRDLEFGALLHDIGKLRVPNEIINKPGKLDAAEWAIIKQHPAYGQEMLDRVGGVLSDVGRIVRAHHERFDGGGYPDGLVGEGIPIEARIITVCDSFSAMTTDRAYRKAMSYDDAIAELRACTPGQFDPAVVDALMEALVRPEAAAAAARVKGSAGPLDAVSGPASVATWTSPARAA